MKKCRYVTATAINGGVGGGGKSCQMWVGEIGL